MNFSTVQNGKRKVSRAGSGYKIAIETNWALFKTDFLTQNRETLLQFRREAAGEAYNDFKDSLTKVTCHKSFYRVVY